jgi:predicted porin
MYASDDANIAPTGGHASTSAGLFSDSDKITYFSPRFGGLQFGASYVPDGDSETGQHSVDDAPKAIDVIDRGYSVSANYAIEIGGADIKMSAGYENADLSITPNAYFYGHPPVDYEPSENGTFPGQAEFVTFGSSISKAGFTLGAGYSESTYELYHHPGEWMVDIWSASLNYGQGPWSVGAQYYNRDSKLSNVPLSEGFSEMWTIGGKYDLGPGITMFGGVQLSDSDILTLNDDYSDGFYYELTGKSQAYFIGTALTF